MRKTGWKLNYNFSNQPKRVQRADRPSWRFREVYFVVLWRLSEEWVQCWYVILFKMWRQCWEWHDVFMQIFCVNIVKLIFFSLSSLLFFNSTDRARSPNPPLCLSIQAEIIHMNFIEIQSWPEIPSIGYFVSLFSQAFNLPEFPDIEVSYPCFLLLLISDTIRALLFTRIISSHLSRKTGFGRSTFVGRFWE